MSGAILRDVAEIWSISFVWYDESEIRQTHAPDRLSLSYPPLAQDFHIVTGSGSA